MAIRVPTQFATPTKNVGTGYTLLGQGVAGHRYLLKCTIVNTSAAIVQARLYVCTSAWSSGQPTSGNNLAATVCRSTKVLPNNMLVVVLAVEGNQKVVGRSSVASTLDFAFMGVDES